MRYEPGFLSWTNRLVAISGNYAHPVIVNGFSCINCAEVAQAKADIDPAKLLVGPSGANDPKKAAEQRHFAPEARDLAYLGKRHAALGAAGSLASAAYAGVPLASGALVSISG